MKLKFHIVYAAHCSGTHHKLAMDALRYLKNENAETWRDLFYCYARDYVEGAKAPDKEFRDFKNHVLHVRENYWGGAPEKTEEWYQKLKQALVKQNWRQAVYSAGVLSHYYTDPIQPFHTGQTEAENTIHRAVEWSISKSYSEISKIADTEFADFNVKYRDGDGWLSQMVLDGAEFSNKYYEMLIANYNFDRGVVDPPSGLNDMSRRHLAQLIRYAQTGFAQILDRVLDESQIQPPKTKVSAALLLSALKIPVKRIISRIEDVRDRKLVQSIYDEVQITGTLNEHLPEDDRVVRDLHAREVLNLFDQAADDNSDLSPVTQPNVQLREKLAEAGKLTSSSSKDFLKTLAEASQRFHLDPADDVEKAPSVGPKTASRFSTLDIHTVSDLLNAEPADVAQRLNIDYINENLIRDWQYQARLVCLVPELRGHDAQILVSCGYRDAAGIARLEPRQLFDEVRKFCLTSHGKRILRSGRSPDLDEVTRWIECAGSITSKKAA